MPPLELVMADSPADQLVVKLVDEGGDVPTRRVEAVETTEKSGRPWITSTQPPLLEDNSMLSPIDKAFLTQLEGVMRGAAIRHQRHVYRASLESDRMQGLRLAVQEHFLDGGE